MIKIDWKNFIEDRIWFGWYVIGYTLDGDKAVWERASSFKIKWVPMTTWGGAMFPPRDLWAMRIFK